MGKIKGFLFAVRHREILMTDLGLWAVTFQSLDNVGTEGSTGLYNVKIFYEWSSENRFFSTELSLVCK